MGEKFHFEGTEYEIFGDDPEEFQKLMDPDGDKKPGITVKFLNRLPKKVRMVPVPESQEDIIKIITGYSIWYLTHYGGHLISLVCGFCGTIFGQVIKARTGIKQERIPFLDDK